MSTEKQEQKSIIFQKYKSTSVQKITTTKVQENKSTILHNYKIKKLQEFNPTIYQD